MANDNDPKTVDDIEIADHLEKQRALDALIAFAQSLDLAGIVIVTFSEQKHRPGELRIAMETARDRNHFLAPLVAPLAMYFEQLIIDNINEVSDQLVATGAATSKTPIDPGSVH